MNCLRYLLVGCCKPHCGALAATCAGGKRPLTATTRLKALPRPPPLRGGFRGVVSYRVKFVRGLLRVCSWVAADLLVGCCGFVRGLLRVCSWVAAGLFVGCCVRAARRVGGCGRSDARPPSPPLLCPRVLLCGFGAFVHGLLGPRCATRRGLRAL